MPNRKSILRLSILFVLFSAFSGSLSAASTPRIAYGWTTAVMPKETQEFFILGFELALDKHLSSESKARWKTTSPLKVFSDTTRTSLAPVGLTEKMIEDSDAILLTGFPTSHEGMLSAERCAKADLLCLYIGASHDGMAHFGPKVLSTAESMSLIAESMVKTASRRFKGKAGLMVRNPRAVYSTQLAGLVKKRVGAMGSNSPFHLDEVDMDAKRRIPEKVLKSLKEKFSFMIFTQYPEESDLLMDQLSSTSEDLTLIVGSAWETMEPLRRLAARRKAPIYSHSIWLRGSKESLPFETAFKQRYGRGVDAVAAYGFDMGIIVSSLINRVSGPLTRAKIIEAYQSNRCFDGTSAGRLCFPEAGGHVNRKIFEVVFNKDKGFVRVED